MTKYFLSIVMVVIAASNAFGDWALIKLDELVAKSDLIVTGTLHSADEDTEGFGKGRIKVDQIISAPRTGPTFTTTGENLKPGVNLKIKWWDGWACAAGMHMGWRGERGI